MKILKKINRGAALTALVVIGVIVYLIINSAVNAIEAENIKAVCSEYIAAEVRYSKLPVIYRSDEQVMPASEQEAYITEMKSHVSPLLVSDATASGQVLSRLEESLRMQMQGQGIIYEYDKKVSEFVSVSITQDVAKVNVLTETIFDGPTVQYGGYSQSTRQRQTMVLNDLIVLQKTDGVWRVFSARLATPADSGMYYYGD